MQKKTIVFDLDDTLVKEIEYLKSAFKSIAEYVDSNDSFLFEKMFQWYREKADVFAKLEEVYDKPLKEELKTLYRNHVPNFDPMSANRKLLLELKSQGHFLGVVTDGYSVTQRNKLRAMDIENIFDLIIVSEEFGSTKPSEKNFMVFHKFQTKEYFYISDNVTKDFIAPNKLGWKTVCLLDNGENIHPQDFNKDALYLPGTIVRDLQEIKQIIAQ